MYLLGGGAMGLMSILFISHCFRYMSLNVEGKTLGPWMNLFLANIEDSVFSYLATVFFILWGLYCLLCAMMGHTKFGMRFFFVSFYPLSPKETFVNAFLANCLLFNIYAHSITHWLALSYADWIAGTAAARIFNVQINNLKIWNWFFSRNFFTVWIIVWWFIAFIYFCLRPYEKINLG